VLVVAIDIGGTFTDLIGFDEAAGAFVQAGFADELLVYVAPVLLGPQARPLLQLPALAELAQVRRFTLIESQPVGADLRLRLRPA